MKFFLALSSDFFLLWRLKVFIQLILKMPSEKIAIVGMRWWIDRNEGPKIKKRFRLEKCFFFEKWIFEKFESVQTKKCSKETWTWIESVRRCKNPIPFSRWLINSMIHRSKMSHLFGQSTYLRRHWQNHSNETTV